VNTEIERLARGCLPLSAHLSVRTHHEDAVIGDDCDVEVWPLCDVAVFVDKYALVAAIGLRIREAQRILGVPRKTETKGGNCGAPRRLGNKT
jgi:hypothetical protein